MAASSSSSSSASEVTVNSPPSALSPKAWEALPHALKLADLKPKRGTPAVAGTNDWNKHCGGYVDDISEEQAELVQKFLATCDAEQIEEMRFPSEPPLYFACRILRAVRAGARERGGGGGGGARFSPPRRAKHSRGVARAQALALVLIAHCPPPSSSPRAMQRKFDLAEALKLVKLTTTWRREKNVRAIRENDPFDILKSSEDEMLCFYPKTYFPTPDLEGRPIYAEKGGLSDIEGLLMLVDGNMDRMVDYHIYGNEVYMRNLFAAMSARAGRPVHTITTIMDMEGMSMKMIGALTRNYIAAMIGIDKEHYPETLGKMIFVNVPGFFSMGFAMIKPFLDERTVRKIEIMSSRDVWKPRLLELVGEANLPVEYGGSLVVPGGLYPPTGTKSLTLPTGKVLNEFAAAKKGETVRCKWFCRPGDIRMSFSFVPGALPPPSASPFTATDVPLPQAPGEVTLKALQDHPGSDTKFVEDVHTAPVDGYFVASFDNRNGWRERLLFWRVDIMVGGRPACAARKA